MSWIYLQSVVSVTLIFSLWNNVLLFLEIWSKLIFMRITFSKFNGNSSIFYDLTSHFSFVIFLFVYCIIFYDLCSVHHLSQWIWYQCQEQKYIDKLISVESNNGDYWYNKFVKKTNFSWFILIIIFTVLRFIALV